MNKVGILSLKISSFPSLTHLTKKGCLADSVLEHLTLDFEVISSSPRLGVEFTFQI